MDTTTTAVGNHSGVSDAHAMPLYHQVYLVIRERIRSGVYGDRALPTEIQFCAMFGVSRITVKHAMRMLARDGFVTRRRGLGTFAVEATVGTPRRNALDDLLQSVQAIGSATAMRRISHGPTRATIEVAEHLGCKPGALVYRIDQIRTSGAEPIAYIQAYLPTWVAARMRDKHTSTLPVLAQIAAAGVEIDRADQAIGATLADPVAAGHLDVEVGLPLIRLTRRVIGTDMNPVEWLVALYRGDRYEYRTTLTRDGLAGRRNDTISTPKTTMKNKRRNHA